MKDLMLVFAVCSAATLALGPPLIRALRTLSYRQHAYEDAPRSHAVKTGTPTMGGVLFVLALLAVGIWHSNVMTRSLVVLGILCACVGAVDDIKKVQGARNRGLSARMKFALTILVGVVFLTLIGSAFGTSRVVGVVARWGTHHASILPVLWYLLALLVILATTHAVNLTDGLDGLACGTIIPGLMVYAWIAWRLGETGTAYADVATLAAAVGFLPYNRYPAKIFMGDTGSLLLGGVLGGSAILTGTLLLLPLIGGVFVAEALSVILQVAYFKKTGKRIFRMSPLHHHFELGGLPETAVTRRFQAASAFLALAGAAIVR
jgi:phospho-N-acetylmuramoyl-pentapeptide-transferase